MQKILLIDDDADIVLLLSKFLSKKGYTIYEAMNATRGKEILASQKIDLVLCDFRLPDAKGLEMIQHIKKVSPKTAVVIITGYSDVKVAIHCIKEGAYDYVTKPIYPDEILLTVKNALESSPIKTKADATSQAKTEKAASDHVELETRKIAFVKGNSIQSEKVVQLIDLVAPTNMSVIVFGETGTGKEFVAKSIHQKSKRKEKPFVALDCGALPKDLALSELFGHKKGAFTGALADKVGSFELANGGTLFLDEIGNLSYENQVKLLRVVQERKIRPLGGEKDIPIDVRLIVATNDNLTQAYKSGEFREDLFHRLNEFKIELAPLRERPEDVKIFARHFLELANTELEKNVVGFEPAVEKKLLNYYWHGNLRELKNVVKRSVLLASGELISPECLPSEILAGPIEPDLKDESTPGGSTVNLQKISGNAEKRAILTVLEQTGYNKSKAAKLLKIDRKTLYNKLKSYQIDL